MVSEVIEGICDGHYIFKDSDHFRYSVYVVTNIKSVTCRMNIFIVSTQSFGK